MTLSGQLGTELVLTAAEGESKAHERASRWMQQ